MFPDSWDFGYRLSVAIITFSGVLISFSLGSFISSIHSL